MGIKTTLTLTGFAIALTGAPATAATFSYHVDDFEVKKKGAGEFKEISTSFNDVSDLFTWSSTFSRLPGKNALAKGAWLVVNDGPNPKKDVREQVIFYLDGIQGVVSAYDYNGKKGSRSWKTSTLLASTALDVIDNGDDRTFGFSLDMTDINAMTETFGSAWKGTAFNENVGIWFHALGNLSTEYSADGELEAFDFNLGRTGWYDVSMKPTVIVEEPQSVPEPGIAIALGMTAAAATFTKRFKQAV